MNTMTLSAGRVTLPRGTLAVVGGLSALTAAIHFQVAPEHYSEWWGYGTFFVLCAAAELMFFWTVARHPTPLVLQVGIWGSMATIMMYLVSRTAGIPLGPGSGAVEGIDLLGIEATTAEALLVVILCSVLDGDARRRTLNMLGAVGVAVWLAAAAGALTPSAGAAADGHGHGSLHGAVTGAHKALPIPFIPDRVRNAPRPPGIG